MRVLPNMGESLGGLCALCLLALVCCSSPDKTLLYRDALPATGSGQQVAFLGISDSVKSMPSEKGLYAVLVELDGHPTPLAGIARVLPLAAGSHELVIALLPKLTYNATEQGVLYYRVKIDVVAGARIRLMAEAVNAEFSVCVIDAVSRGVISSGILLAADEAEQLRSRHRRLYVQMEESGELRMR